MRIPPALIALDVLGTLLLALGIYGKVASDPVLGFVDLGPFAVPLIILGAFLMAPLLLHVVRAATSGKR
jgi:hypothetical protein